MPRLSKKLVQDLNLTGQTRVAQAFLLTQDHHLKHVHGLDWFFWTSSRWIGDSMPEARRRLHTVMQSLWTHALKGNVQMERDVKMCSTNSAQEGVLKIAQNFSAFSLRPDQLDADPYLLNLQNGTYDLRTHTLRPHDPQDFITKIAGASYDPDADTSEWNEFLERILPDPEVRAYLQRFMGLSLIGEVIEPVLGIAIGTGANGKSTFINAMAAAFGDYYRQAESALFLTTKDNANAASPALLALMGVRFVACSETEEGQQLAASLIKNLTGGDPVTARGVYARQSVTFKPALTPLLVTNHLPKVKGNDSALFRRIRVIPFNVVIPEAEQDTKLTDRLRQSPDALLLWALEGLKDYQLNGMQTPAAVVMATDRYRTDSDAVARFVRAHLIVNPNGRVNRTEVWMAWKKWTVEENLPSGGMSDFYTELEKESGFTQIVSRGNRMFKGFTLRHEARPEDEVFLTLVQEEQGTNN